MATAMPLLNIFIIGLSNSRTQRLCMLKPISEMLQSWFNDLIGNKFEKRIMYQNESFQSVSYKVLQPTFSIGQSSYKGKKKTDVNDTDKNRNTSLTTISFYIVKSFFLGVY